MREVWSLLSLASFSASFAEESGVERREHIPAYLRF